MILEILQILKVLEWVTFIPVFSLSLIIQVSLLGLYGLKYRVNLCSRNLTGMCSFASIIASVVFLLSWIDYYQASTGYYPNYLSLFFFGLGVLATNLTVKLAALQLLLSTRVHNKKYRANLRVFHLVNCVLFLIVFCVLLIVCKALGPLRDRWAVFCLEVLFMFEWLTSAWNCVLAIESADNVLDRVGAFGDAGDKPSLRALMKWRTFLKICKVLCLLLTVVSFSYVVTLLGYHLSMSTSLFPVLLKCLLSILRGALITTVCGVFIQFSLRKFALVGDDMKEIDNSAFDEDIFKELDAVYYPNMVFALKN